MKFPLLYQDRLSSAYQIKKHVSRQSYENSKPFFSKLQNLFISGQFRTKSIFLFHHKKMQGN